jgi:hypothetical protein
MMEITVHSSESWKVQIQVPTYLVSGDGSLTLCFKGRTFWLFLHLGDGMNKHTQIALKRALIPFLKIELS